MRQLRPAKGMGDADAGAGPDTDRAPTDRMPLWLMVKSSLTAMILDHGLEPNTRLPSEGDLCRKFNVSRTVVREAMSQLVNEGLIYRLQGKGAFVRSRREVQDFVSTAVGFTGELADKNRVVSRQILRQTIGPAGPRVRSYLKIAEGDPVVSIDRVMLVDGIPRAIVRWKMPASVVPGLEGLNLQNRSLYETLARQYGIILRHAERWIEAVSLTPEEASQLKVDPERAALRVESVAGADRDRPIEYFVAIYLTDRSRLHVTVNSGRV